MIRKHTGVCDMFLMCRQIWPSWNTSYSSHKRAQKRGSICKLTQRGMVSHEKSLSAGEKILDEYAEHQSALYNCHLAPGIWVFFDINRHKLVYEYSKDWRKWTWIKRLTDCRPNTDSPHSCQLFYLQVSGQRTGVIKLGFPGSDLELDYRNAPLLLIESTVAFY